MRVQTGIDTFWDNLYM